MLNVKQASEKKKGKNKNVEKMWNEKSNLQTSAPISIWCFRIERKPIISSRIYNNKQTRRERKKNSSSSTIHSAKKGGTNRIKKRPKNCHRAAAPPGLAPSKGRRAMMEGADNNSSGQCDARWFVIQKFQQSDLCRTQQKNLKESNQARHTY